MKIGGVVCQVLLVTGLSACGGGTGLGSYTTAGNSQTSSLLGTSGGVTLSTGTGTGAGTTDDNNVGTSIVNAEGVWRGTSDTGRTLTGLILDNGFYWMLYSAAGNNGNIVGVIVGNSLSGNGTVNSNNGKDFNFETNALLPFALQGSYTPRARLQAALTYTDIPGSSVTISANHDNNYNLAPSIATLSGRYTGSSNSLINGSRDTAFSIDARGQLTGSRVDGCTFTGTVFPRPRGNAYSVSLAYGNNCLERNAGGSSGSTGSAYFDPSNRQLYSVTLNSTARDVLVFVGNRQ